MVGDVNRDQSSKRHRQQNRRGGFGGAGCSLSVWGVCVWWGGGGGGEVEEGALTRNDPENFSSGNGIFFASGSTLEERTQSERNTPE